MKRRLRVSDLGRIVVLAGSVLAYIAALHYCYVSRISPLFSYLGFVYYAPGTSTLALSWLFAMTPVLLMPMRLSRPSQVVIWLLYLLVYIPAQIFPRYTLELSSGAFLRLSVVLLVAFMVIVVAQVVPTVGIKRVTIAPQQYWLILIGFSLISYAYIVLSFGFRSSIPNIANVYDVRLEYREEVANKGPFLAYFILWQGNIVNNLAIARGVIGRRYSQVALGFLGQLLIFSIAGYKSMFFSSLMILGVMLAARGGGKRFGLNVAWGGTLLILTATLLDRMLDTIVYTSLFVRRMIVAPGLVTGFYYEFFSKNPKTLMSQSILSPFFDYPYDTTYNFLIGYYYYGRIDVSMNANFLGDGFANFGFLGVLLAAFALSCLLWIVDCLARDRDLRIVSMVLGITAFSLSNSALPTAIVSHGFGFLLVLLALMPRSAPQTVAETARAPLPTEPMPIHAGSTPEAVVSAGRAHIGIRRRQISAPGIGE